MNSHKKTNQPINTSDEQSKEKYKISEKNIHQTLDDSEEHVDSLKFSVVRFVYFIANIYILVAEHL